MSGPGGPHPVPSTSDTGHLPKCLPSQVPSRNLDPSRNIKIGNMTDNVCRKSLEENTRTWKGWGFGC